MEKQEIINSLLKNGCKKFDGLTVRNVTVTTQDSYVRVAFSLDKSVPAYNNNGTGTFELNESNVVFVSAFSIASVLKDDDIAAFAANHIVQHPETMNVILSRAKITIIQEPVTAGEEYKNPFASDKSTVTVFDHDTIINHIVGIELSKFGVDRLMHLADKMMGF